MKPFKKVKVGDKATDYNGDVWGVLAVGKVKDLMKYDDSGAAGELDPNEDGNRIRRKRWYCGILL